MFPIVPTSAVAQALQEIPHDLGELHRPPTVTVALGGLREAHRSSQCGTVVLATCGLEPEDRSHDRLTRLLPPAPGFELLDSVDTMVRDGGRSVASRWREVRRRSVGVVIGETGCLGFGLLALQTLRGAGTWHHLSLVATETTAARIIAQHPEVAAHLALAEAAALPPETWVVETDHVAPLEQVLRRGEQVILGPRASAAVAGQGLRQELRERTGKTVMVTRNADLAEFGDTAEIIVLSGGMLTAPRDLGFPVLTDQPIIQYSPGADVRVAARDRLVGNGRDNLVFCAIFRLYHGAMTELQLPLDSPTRLTDQASADAVQLPKDETLRAVPTGNNAFLPAARRSGGQTAQQTSAVIGAPGNLLGRGGA